MPTKEEVDLEKSQVELEKLQFELAQEKLKALIPDLSSVKSELSVDGDHTLGEGLLGSRVLTAAAQKVAADLAVRLEAGSVLITTQADLLSTDAVHSDVWNGLEQLIDQAKAAIEPAPRAFGPVEVLAGIAAAVPSVLSLLSAKRSVTTSALSVEDAEAAHRVAVLLAAKKGDLAVFLDDFTLVPDAPDLSAKLTELNQLREQLRGVIDTNDDRLEPAKLVADLVDKFLGKIHTTPEKGRSPFVIASLHDLFHRAGGHVVLIKAQPGSTSQMTEDRPLWVNDKFSVVASMAISYVIIDPATGQICGGGVQDSIQHLHGAIGTQIYRPQEADF